MSRKAFHAQFRWPRGAGCLNGRNCIDHLDRGFDDAAFWERWMDRLHPDECRAIVNDEIGTIKRPVEPTWPVGVEMQVASNYWITPETPKFTHRGWRIHFSARDFRVRLPRQTPGMFEPPDMDAQGYPIDPTQGAIDRATELGNYTPSHELSVPDTDESVDELAQRRITAQSKKDDREALGELFVALEDLRQAIGERMSSPEARRLMGRDAWALRSKIDSIERRLKRRHAA